MAKRIKKQRKIDLTRIVAVIVIVLAVIYFYLNIFSPTTIPDFLRIGVLREPINILMIGTDITYDAVTLKPMPNRKSRADTIVLIHIDPINFRASALSIPRDTLVDIPDYGKQKINFANAWGGRSMVKQIVSDMTGQKIDYFIEIKPTAVTKLIDLLGGVTVYVDVNMRYQDRAQGLNIDLKKGWQKLSGKQAHDYIRYRDNYRGDIVRIEHQQNFLKATAKELTKPTNIIKAPFAVLTALQEIKTNLPFSKILRLLNLARMFPMENIQTVMAPGDVTMEAQVGSVWIVDDLAMQSAIKNLF
jgi:polyisoprenyl-teichoic acid--peptidoglycan teichoic acid transferase